jgi:hypothetical protein
MKKEKDEKTCATIRISELFSVDRVVRQVIQINNHYEILDVFACLI